MGWYNGWSPEQRIATLQVQRNAIRTEAIRKPVTCSICRFTPTPGSDNPVWLHDEDYSQPLLAFHVCRSCHRLLHERFERLDPWRALVYAHGTGDRWFEYLTMDPAAQWRPFGETYPDGLPRGGSDNS